MSKTDSTRWLDWRVNERGDTIRLVRTCECGDDFTPSDPSQDSCGPCVQARKHDAGRMVDKFEDDFLESQWKAFEEIERIRRDLRR